MPDISMCQQASCPKRGKCYRYRVVPDEYRQSYADFREHSVQQPCERFAPTRRGDSLRATEHVDQLLKERLG